MEQDSLAWEMNKTDDINFDSLSMLPFYSLQVKVFWTNLKSRSPYKSTERQFEEEKSICLHKQSSALGDQARRDEANSTVRLVLAASAAVWQALTYQVLSITNFK